MQHTEFNFHNEGVQYIYEFDNGLKLSAILTPYSYGGEQGLWEIGVYKHGIMWYNSPITNNYDAVLCYLKWDQVQDKLKECEEWTD